MKTQLAMVIDAAKCFDCKGCMASCKVANEVPAGFWRNWVKHEIPDVAGGVFAMSHFQPGGCMQCDKPTCVTACPTGATYKDPADGVVKIDPKLCIGCGNCIPACPYGARYRHPEKRIADKCDFCASRRARGLSPACVDTCPTKARVFGDLGDPESEVSRLIKENQGKVVRIVNAKSDTEPNMYYIAGALPADWPHEAEIRSPMKAMISVVNPCVKIAAGLAGLGALVMFGKQLFTKNDDDGDHKDQGGAS